MFQDSITTSSEAIQWLSLFAVALACSVFFGWELVGRLSTQIDTMVRLGTGILVGLSALGLLQTSVPLLHRFPVLALPILVLFGVLLRPRTPIRWPLTHWDNSRLKVDARRRFRDLYPTLLVIVGSAVFSVNYAAGFPRLLGTAIILRGLTFNYKNRLSHTARLFMGLVTITLLGLSELVRRYEPGWWLAASNDAPFFESLGWSLATNGPRSHPGLPEGTIFGYHYLGYATSGALSKLSGAPPYYVLNVLLPLLLLSSLALVLFPQILRHTESFAVSTGLLVVLGSVLRVTSITSFLFSNWAIAIYLTLLLELQQEGSSRSLSIKHQALLATVAFIAVFGKATALPIVGAIALISSLGERPTSFERRPKKLLQYIPWHIAPAGVFFIAYYLPNAQSYSEEGEISVIRVLKSLPNNEGAWRLREDLVWIVFLVGVTLIARATQKVHMPRDIAAARTLLMWVPAVGLSLALFVSNYLQREYLARHVSFVITLLMMSITLHLIRFSRSPQRNATSAALLTVFAILGFASYFAVFRAPLISRSLENLIQEPRGRWTWFVIAGSESLLPALVVFTAFALLLSLNRATRASARATTAVFALPLGLTLCLSIANSVEHHSSVTSNADGTATFDASHPDTATSEVGRFLRMSTPSDAIIASNSFCCSGTEWLANALSELEEFTSIYGLEQYGEKSRGGANYLSVSVSRRQFLIAGPRFLWMSPDKTNLGERLEASVLFGATGSSLYETELHNDGADYFLLDKAALGNLAIPAFEERVLFENSRYLVLNLNT